MWPLSSDVRPQMESWSPATEKDVSSIVERDLSGCPAELLAFFTEVRVPLRAVPIARSGEIESVYVVAERDGMVIYYEDVEEGFNLSRLGDDGGIASPGWEQWDLCQALLRLSA